MKRNLRALGILLLVSIVILAPKTVKAEEPIRTSHPSYPWYGEVDGAKCHALTVRKGPGRHYPPEDWLLPGCVVRVTRKVGDWYEITDSWKWWLPPRYVHGGYIRPLKLPSAPPPDPMKWIEINLATQTLVAYEGEKPVFSARVSTGVASRFGTLTPKGEFRIFIKLPVSRMYSTTPGDIYHFWVSYVMYFHASGYTIHGTHWHNDFGRPRSHGCVNLTVADARWLYGWTPVGTKVWIHI